MNFFEKVVDLDFSSNFPNVFWVLEKFCSEEKGAKRGLVSGAQNAAKSRRKK